MSTVLLAVVGVLAWAESTQANPLYDFFSRKQAEHGQFRCALDPRDVPAPRGPAASG